MSYLNHEELQLGQECSTDEFWQRYRPEMAQALRGTDSRTAHPRKTEGVASDGASALPGDGRDAPKNSVGEKA